MPNQYQLLRHAVTLADQLEAAGVREATTYHDEKEMTWRWKRHTYLWLLPDESCVWDARLAAGGQFRVGDPLPPELIAAIKATEGADA